jgi:hypothetical protein
LLAAAVENRRNNGRERQSGGGSIYNASNGLSLNPFFLVVIAKKITNHTNKIFLVSILIYNNIQVIIYVQKNK